MPVLSVLEMLFYYLSFTQLSGWHPLAVLWQIRSKAVVLMRETLDLGLPHRAADPQTMQEDNAGRIRRSCFA